MTINLRKNSHIGLVLLKINKLVSCTQRTNKTLSRIFNIVDGVLALNDYLILSQSYNQ